MADQKFAIQKQIFEIGAVSRVQVHELQNRVSHLVNYSLIQKMENYFREVIPADLLLRMDELVLDIGEVNLVSMEDEIEQRFMEALEYEFTQRLAFLKNDKTNSLAGISIETTDKGKLELFEYFLLYGALPWYADTAVKFNIDQLLNQLYTGNRSALKDIIQRTGKDLNVRQRISYQFSDKTIKQLITIIEPAEAAYIFQAQKELVKVQQNKQVVQEAEKDFRKTVWLFILNYLLAEMGSVFEKKMFVKSNLTQIAAHYNISYHYLLHSFYDVIKTLKKTEVFQPLKTVIYELFTEETTASKNKSLIEMDQTTEPDILTLSSKIELLLYYLYTGSLPLAYQKMNRHDIKQLLFNMTKLAPATIRKLLLSLNKQPKGIFNFYQVIDTTETDAFVKLFYRGNENEIENIVTLFSTLHQAIPFGNYKSRDLENEAWKYLLDHFLFKGKADYDETTVMEYLVKRMAISMGHTESGLVTLLKAALKKITVPGIEITGPAFLFKEVLYNMDKNRDADEADHVSDHYKEELQQDENSFSAAHTTDQLSAVISYILQYGAVPWWAHGYYRFSLEELITRLYEKDAAAMLLLFRKAIAKPAMKTRLVLDIPGGIFRNLIQQLPGGAEVILHVDELLVILDESKMMRYHSDGYVQKIILTLAWEMHSSSGYALFPAMIFYYELIKRFSALLKVESGVIVSALVQSASKIAPAFAGNTKNVLQALQDHFDEQKPESPAGAELLPPVDIAVALEEKHEKKQRAAEMLLLIDESEVIQLHFDFTGRSPRGVVTELRAVLEYFLQWNRLPDNLALLEKDEQKKLLREILMILFSGSLIVLRSLIEDKANAAPARAYLNELFSIAEGGKEKLLAGFLFEINLPVLDTLVNHAKAENYFPEQDTTTVDLEKIFLKYPGAATGDMILEASKRVLQYFLKYNRLPDDIVIGKEAMERLLREIILFLFRQDKMFMYEQFQNPAVSIAAKLYLYDLLTVSTDIRTSQVKDFMQHLEEADMHKLLLQAEQAGQTVSEKDPSALMMQILQTATPATIKQDTYFFLSSALFAKMVLQRSGTQMLLKLASFKINWPFTSESVIQGWFKFLQKAISPGLYKEKFMDLFNRFNILFISGRLSVYSNDSYTIAFMNYLSGQLGMHAGSVFSQLFNYTLQSAKKPVAGIAAQYHLMQRMLRPLIMQQEELKLATAAITASEEKKLSNILKQEITRYRQQLSESLKKETMQHADITAADETDTDNKFKPETGESIYIANAGLVLFHPFLEPYFSRTGLMENYVFIDDACRNRAVLLLQYLATGNTEYAEHELVLNKILCNVPLQEAIPVSFTATETEIDITRELLEVVIERWDKMKNTSPEGLQNSFIMRDGMLNFREDHWSLKVEQRGYDVLLQTLPWAFGYIKTSWMQHNLIVEWI